MTAPASATDLRIRDGMADLVSRREAFRIASLPKTSTAAPTAAGAPYTSVVVIRSWAASACSCSSLAPYSALPNPPKRAVPSSMVISAHRRSPWEIWCSCNVPSDCHTRATPPSPVKSLIRVPDGGVCAYKVHPRSSAAMARVEEFATPTSPIAMAISARCSTARRMEGCSGAVSLLRNRSQRQNWRRNPPLR